MEEENRLIAIRKKKLEELKKEGLNPFPNDFKVSHTTQEIGERVRGIPPEKIGEIEEDFVLAGRIIAIRDFGKASFIHLQDRKGKLQAYIRKDQVGEKSFSLFKKLDIGDFIGIRGKIFLTHTGELTVMAKEIRPLVKSLRPLPEKWHGIIDVESRYRQRYLDLIVNPGVKEVFLLRSKTIQLIREFLSQRDFLEVETPMMQPLPGGALARPFKTHHNALDMDLYLRIAPELYLKRLVIGGLERVFEINRNFRNEGLSSQHNPEFTMLEFYQAYATYGDLMNLTEEMICFIVQELFGQLKLEYQGEELDFTPPWKRLTLKEAILGYGKVEEKILSHKEEAFEYAQSLGINISKEGGLGEIITEIFDQAVEPHLIQPTFITHYPTEVSPLSRSFDNNPEEVERFELFIAGKEIANAFSELNDPIEQKERFLRQLEKRGEGEEDLKLDQDFLKALEYGMPPTAGEGIGIDRLVMLLTNSPSIREVILFPLLRSEK